MGWSARRVYDSYDDEAGGYRDFVEYIHYSGHLRSRHRGLACELLPESPTFCEKGDEVSFSISLVYLC